MSSSPTEKLDLGYEAASVAWGRENCVSVEFPATVATADAGEYWEINVVGSDYKKANEVKYYAWLDDGIVSDPAPAGRTGIAISFSDGDSGSVVAASAQVALDAVSNLRASVSGAVVTYENSFIGEVSEEDKSNAPALTFVQLQTSIGGELGSTLEGIELSMETQVGVLSSNQTASYVLGEVVQGAAVSMSMSLAEMTKERWETVIGGVVGDSFTPSGGTRMVGLGESKLFQNLFDLGGKLILHPLSNEASDRSEDVVFWRSAPKPSTINYDGVNQQGLSVSFTAYLDRSKPAAINIFAQGDWTQDLV